MTPDLVGYRLRVVLTEADIRRVRDHALATEAAAKRHGWQHKWTPPGRDMVAQKASAFGAELAVSRVTGLPWNPYILGQGYTRSHKPADVGTRVEVRTAITHLWQYENDRPDWYLVAVSGWMPAYVVHGWARASDFRLPARWTERRDHPGAWSLPLDELWPLPLPEDA